MSSFTEDPVLTLLKKRRVKVYKTFTFYYKDKDGESVTIPEGYISDGATIPRIFWIFFPPIDDYAKAAIVHDYMYEHAIKTKKEADRALLNGMLALKEPKWKCYLFYWCAVLVGRGAY